MGLHDYSDFMLNPQLQTKHRKLCAMIDLSLIVIIYTYHRSGLENPGQFLMIIIFGLQILISDGEQKL